MDVTARSSPTRSSRWAWMAVAVAAAIAAGLVLLATKRGVGVSSDSADYLSGARNLAGGRGFTDFSLEPITIFPPGFSMTLAFGKRLGVEPGSAARWLNAAAFAMLVVLTFVLARRHLRSTALSVWAAAAVAFAPAMLGVETFAWTEPVFCVIVVGTLLLLETLQAGSSRNVAQIALVAALAGVAFAFRYAGLTLLATAGIVIARSAWPDGVRAVLRRVLVYVVIASVVPACIVARNLSEGTGLLGDRSPAAASADKVARRLVSSLSTVVLDGFPIVVRAAALVAAAALALAGLRIAVQRGRGRTWAPAGSPILVVAVFTVGYFAYLVSSELSTNIDPLDSRLLSPVIAPAIVLGALALRKLFMINGPSGPRARSLLAALLVLWLGTSFVVSANHARTWGADPRGYASMSWQGSPLARRARALPGRSAVFSNLTAGLWVAGVRQPVYPSPRSRAYRSQQSVNDLPDFRRHIDSAPAAYLVWYSAGATPFLVSPDALNRLGFSVVAVATTRDGTLYRVRDRRITG